MTFLSISADMAALLRLYGPDTYAVTLGWLGQRMEKRGLVEWVPGQAWSGVCYAITAKGREALKAYDARRL